MPLWHTLWIFKQRRLLESLFEILVFYLHKSWAKYNAFAFFGIFHCQRNET